MAAVRAGPFRFALQAVIAVVAVVLVSLALSALDADRTAAALVLVLVVVLLTFVGTTALAVGIAASFLSLGYFFIPPGGTLDIGKVDDLVALLVLVATGGALGMTLARVNRLRHRSDLREQEIRLRLELANRLADGDEPAGVVGEAEAALRRMFDAPGLSLRLAPDGRLSPAPGASSTIAPADRAEIAAFVLGLDTAIERSRLADEVQAARVAAAIEQSRASFLAAMTHNLRTPLATIKAAISGLRGGDGELTRHDRTELLDAAYSESDRLERLVSKVLALSRIRAGAITPSLEPLDLAEVAQVAVQRLSVLARDREILLETPADLPLVAADPDLLDVALVNLLENALRYAPDGPIVIRGRVEDRAVVLEVEDRGPGVPATERERVFEEFVRVDRLRDTTGTGIGLTIARAFVDAQGGAISLVERPGGGTRVKIALERNDPRPP